MEFMFDIDPCVIDQLVNDVLCSQDPLLHHLDKRDKSIDQHAQSAVRSNEYMDLAEAISVDVSPLSSSSSMSSDPEVVVSTPEVTERTVSRSDEHAPPATSIPEELAPPSQCQICVDGNAGKHVYYGGRGSCLSCRAFFRRSVQSQQFELFVCPADQRCVITSKSRKSCQWCRFQRCLGSGMEPRWVLDDGQRKERLIKRNKSRARGCGRPKGVCDPVQPNAIVMTEDEVEFLEKLAAQTDREVLELYGKLCCGSGSLMNSILEAFFTNKKLTYEEIKDCEMIDKTSFQTFLLRHEELQCLTDGDRKALILHNSPVLFGIYWAVPQACMDQTNINEMLNFFREHGTLDVKAKIQSYKDLKIQPACEYNQFYHSPWAASLEDEKEHLSLSKKMTSCLMDTSQLKADHVFTWLLNLVILFSSNCANLQENHKIEAIQNKYLLLLYKYLKHMYKSQARQKLGSSLMILSYGKSAYELHQKRLPV